MLSVTTTFWILGSLFASKNMMVLSTARSNTGKCIAKPLTSVMLCYVWCKFTLFVCSIWCIYLSYTRELWIFSLCGCIEWDRLWSMLVVPQLVSPNIYIIKVKNTNLRVKSTNDKKILTKITTTTIRRNMIVRIPPTTVLGLPLGDSAAPPYRSSFLASNNT